MTAHLFAVDPEQALLCSCLFSASALTETMAALGEDATVFADPRHHALWRVIAGLWRTGQPVNVSALAVWSFTHDMAACGGESYLGDVVQAYVPGGWQAGPFLAALREAHARRQAQTVAQMLGTTLEAGSDVPASVADALARLGQVSAGTGQARPLSETMLESLDTWAQGPPSYLTTSFPGLDLLLQGGFGAGQLVYLAAQTSRGKTAWALHFAEHAARVHQVGVAVFSLEMVSDELNGRWVAAGTHQSARRVRDDYHRDPVLRAQVVSEAGRLADLPIWVQDASHLTIGAVEAECQRLHLLHGLGLVLVDYIGLLDKPDGKISRNEWLGLVSQRLKGLAKTLGCPVVALSQLSRDSVKTGRAPDLHDLRDSGNLEQDANVVLMLHRPSYSLPDARAVRLDLLVRKNRGGPLGEVPILFRTATGRFEPWVEGMAP